MTSGPEGLLDPVVEVADMVSNSTLTEVKRRTGLFEGRKRSSKQVVGVKGLSSNCANVPLEFNAIFFISFAVYFCHLFDS